MIFLKRELIQESDSYIDDDDNHKKFSQLGERFFDAFEYDTEADNISTQVRNLQQITCSATRFADIEDFVKNQMGKEKTGEAQKTPWKAVGNAVLEQLEALREKSQELETDPYHQMALRLRLARGWVRAVVSAYLYKVACDQMERGGT